MLVYAVDVLVKKGFENDFLEAIEKNRKSTLKEPGNYRFDVSQSQEEPSSFFLYEVYGSEEDVAAHKSSHHYLEWRETVADWMDKPRTGRKFEAKFPREESEW
ncbi:MAG: antibiotic biosynthesis monooxygenase [Spirochaetales bacterium]|nr:antibiotic biosynthesis monooxygenase [Spirochaetales bacterium]